MTSLRSVALAALILAGFIPVTVAVAQAPVEWYTDGGGGALAQPGRDGPTGAAVVPLAGGVVPLKAGAIDDTPGFAEHTPPAATSAHAARAPGRASAERSSAPPGPQATAAQAAPTVTGGEDQPSAQDGLIASLPLTGLQLAAVAGAGLCLLLAGAALRPRRRTAASP
jgi:hypothetical protein